MKLNLKTALILGLLAAMLAACQGNFYTATQQQDAANALAEVREAKELVIRNAPTSVSMVTMGDVSDTAAILPQDAQDYMATIKYLSLAETSLFSVCEEFKTRPLQHEKAKQLVERKNYDELSRIASEAKLLAAKNPIDKISVNLFGVGFMGLVGGLVVWGIIKGLGAKNPLYAEMFKKFVASFQVTRTETPLEIAKQLSERFEGINIEDAKIVVKNALDNSLRNKLPGDVQKKIDELKKQMGLKV